MTERFWGFKRLRKSLDDCCDNFWQHSLRDEISPPKDLTSDSLPKERGWKSPSE